MLLVGKTYDAAEALEMRFVERVVAPAELDTAVAEWVDGICAAGPLAIKSQKKLMTVWEDSSLRGGIAAGIDAIADAYLTGEPQERIEAFFAAKKPRAEHHQTNGRVRRSLQLVFIFV